MMKLFSGVSALVMASVAGLATAQAETRTITFLFTDDDQGYVQRMSELSKEFETANPGVKINFVSSGYDAVSSSCRCSWRWARDPISPRLPTGSSRPIISTCGLT